jgi:hypothetical protein
VAGVAPVEGETNSRAAADCRCLCGNLLARLVTGGVEVKCRRCKRTLLLPLEPERGGAPADRSNASPARSVG